MKPPASSEVTHIANTNLANEPWTELSWESRKDADAKGDFNRLFDSIDHVFNPGIADSTQDVASQFTRLYSPYNPQIPEKFWLLDPWILPPSMQNPYQNSRYPRTFLWESYGSGMDYQESSNDTSTHTYTEADDDFSTTDIASSDREWDSQSQWSQESLRGIAPQTQNYSNSISQNNPLIGNIGSSFDQYNHSFKTIDPSRLQLPIVPCANSTKPETYTDSPSLKEKKSLEDAEFDFGAHKSITADSNDDGECTSEDSSMTRDYVHDEGPMWGEQKGHMEHTQSLRNIDRKAVKAPRKILLSTRIVKRRSEKVVGSEGKGQTIRQKKKTSKERYLCNRDHCQIHFSNVADLRKHIQNKHDRPFECTFKFAGCTQAFGSKNEWKRHVSSQHMHLQEWKCDYPICKDRNAIFNRKDLFGQHLRRMHSPSDPHCQEKWTCSEIPEIQDRCMIVCREPPTESNCEFCELTFSGPKSWETKMEHVGKVHYEAGERPHGDNFRKDAGLIKWALKNEIIELDATSGFGNIHNFHKPCNLQYATYRLAKSPWTERYSGKEKLKN
ncbi:hypothetical protein BDZ91DRAFT_793548 [Kalaharituber pfeilii]|nr:hypothetical protein BDZ91DRAFT_793548 [Kalaharituber pfeilii]